MTNREQRRAQKRAEPRRPQDTMLPVIAAGHVVIDGDPWGAIAAKAFALASIDLNPPKAMPQFSMAGAADVTRHVTMLFDQHGDSANGSLFHDIDRALLAAQGELDPERVDSALLAELSSMVSTNKRGPVAVEIDGRTFDWTFIRVALAFIRPDEEITFGIAQADGGDTLRIDAPRLRFVAMEFLNWTGHVIKILSRDEMDVIESTAGDA